MRSHSYQGRTPFLRSVPASAPRRPAVPCAKPRPTALKKVVRADAPISEFRNLYCRHYGACIDVAVRAGWESFTCARWAPPSAPTRKRVTVLCS